MPTRLTQEEINSIPNKWLETIIHYLSGFRNDTVDFSRPHLRPSVANVYPLFVLMYGALIIAGTLMNFAMVYHIVKYSLYRDPTYAFLINIAIADVIKCIFVLPISLTVMLVQNWVFGKFLCYFLPMLQDIPIHVSMITYLLIAWDRFRMLADPMKPRIPAFVCALGTWFFAVCIVLPYPIYTTYLDLEEFLKSQFEGVGICAANLADDIQEYMRGLFIGTYVAPLTVTAYLYVKASRELQTQEGPLAVAMFEARSRDSYSRHGSRASNDITTGRDGKRESGSVSVGGAVGLSGISGGYDLYDAELDVRKEKRTQKYLVFMVAVFAICSCPLMVLRLAKLALVETYENSAHFDITFTMFVWVAFMPVVTTPGFYASWQMSRPTKERLRGYFRFSNRRMPQGCDDQVRMAPRHTSRRAPAGHMNVAYTQNARTGSVTGSNLGGGSSRGSATLQSPDLVSDSCSTHRASLMQ